LGPNDELIVVDDGSTDNTPSLIKNYLDDRVQYIRLPNSGGPAHPRNVGCTKAKGEFVFIFDADDLAAPGKVDRSISALESTTSADFLFTNFNTIDGNGAELESRYIDRYVVLERLRIHPMGNQTYYIPGTSMVTALLQANFIGTSSVVFRKSAWEKTRGFDEQFLHLDDRDMWLQLSLRGGALLLDQCLHSYRNHQGGISKQRIRKQHLERLVVAERLSLMPLSRQQRQSLRKFRARNYLKLGYIDFHETGNKSLSAIWFFNSFRYQPSLSALKGLLKSYMPDRLYLLLRRS
tara:strand:- start:13822 stop:14700 length:879 start_codon:yes stop_codon:yes gene_type:complete